MDVERFNSILIRYNNEGGGHDVMVDIDRRMVDEDNPEKVDRKPRQFVGTWEQFLEAYTTANGSAAPATMLNRLRLAGVEMAKTVRALDEPDAGV